MIEPALYEIGSPEYRRLGLLANPFVSPQPHEALRAVDQAVCHADASRLSVAILQEAQAERARPIWVTKSKRLPDYYTRISLSEVLGTVPSCPEINVLIAYVPFVSMRTGRIRSALDALAEKVAGYNFGTTLGYYVAHAFASPDDGLLEEAGLAPNAAVGLAERFASEPALTSAEFFGEDLPERTEGVAADDLMRETSMRIIELEADPEAIDESPSEVEEELEEPLDVTKIQDAGDSEDADEAAGPPSAESVRHYAISHARAHLSPIIARAIEAFVENGWYAVGQELKVTRAPRKTLAAIAEFATFRYSKVLILWDQFDGWNAAPDELRLKIAGALAEIRMLLAKSGVLVFLAGSTELLEIQDQFAGAHQVAWSMDPLFEEFEDDDLPSGLVEYLVEANSLDGGIPESLADLKMPVEGVGEKRLGDLKEEVDRRASGVDA